MHETVGFDLVRNSSVYGQVLLAARDRGRGLDILIYRYSEEQIVTLHCSVTILKFWFLPEKGYNSTVI